MTAAAGSSYAAAALKAEVARVRSASPGGRQTTLNRAAFALGQLVAGGVLGAAIAETELLNSAIAIGLSEREARSTVRSAFRDAAHSPRRPPERSSRRRAVDGEQVCRRDATAGEAPGNVIIPPPVKRPPVGEVHTAWAACMPVTDDPKVSAWLEGRQRPLDPLKVADTDIARAIPREIALPAWMSRGGAWNQVAQQYRVGVAMYDATGAMVTLHARALHPQDATGRDKAASPKGYQVRGSVMADGLGLSLLRGVTWPTSETVASFVRESRGLLPTVDGPIRCGLLICEGVPDVLAAATTWSDCAEDVPAILGVIAGSWSPDIAARVPDGTRVVIACHADPAGDHYAEEIAKTLKDRCELMRWKTDPEVP